jgi:hypothetical protein
MSLFEKFTGSRSGGDSENADFKPGKDGKKYVKDPDQLYKDMVTMRDEALRLRRPHEQQWRLNWKYYKGDQWHRIFPDWKIEKVDVGKKPKITLNRVMPVVQTRRAHVLKNRPIGLVMPRTPDEEDRNAARIAGDLIQYDYYHLKVWEKLDREVSLWMFVTGNCFRKVYYDPTKGEKKEKNKYVTNPENGAPITTAPEVPEGGVLGPAAPAPTPQPIAKAVAEPMGDVCVDTVYPIELLPEPGARNLEDCQKIIHRTFPPVYDVKRKFKAAAKKIEPIDTKSSWGLSLLRGATDFGMTEAQLRDRVEVIELWCRPSEEYPDGLYAVWADDQLMEAGPTPDGHDHIPFVHYQEVETDEFWGTCTVSQILDPQRALNLNVSRDEFVRQRLRPKLVAASDSGLDEEAWSNDETEINFVQHPLYPKYIEPPAFSRDEKAVLYWGEAIDNIGGSTDILRGQIEGGDVRSGRMVAYMQEYAGTVLSGPSRSIERGEERTCNLILRLRKHYTDEPRFYFVLGRNRSVEVRSFIASDIEGAADYVVQAGSALPTSLAEKRDMVFRSVETGVLPPGDPRLIKMLGFPSDIEELMNEDQLDRDNATEEGHRFFNLKEEELKLAVKSATAANAEMIQATGQLPMDEILRALKLDALDFENHVVHREQHDKDRKSKAYRNMHPVARALFDAHCEMHKRWQYPVPPPMPIGLGAPGGEPGAPPDLTGGPASLVPGGGGGPGGAGGPAQEVAGGLPPVPSVPPVGGA